MTKQSQIISPYSQVSIFQLNMSQSDKINTTHKVPDTTELNREVTPILEELMTLGPDNDQHPCVRQLSKWLEDPQRSGEEFSYVIGKLAHEVMGYRYSNYLGKLAAEALAGKCLIIEDSWEEVAWIVLYLNNYYNCLEYGFFI